ncbi:Exostosin-1 [Seminavis robusta]|uniref:Exostosin-1 n=1 Tax=Seminavis robusta TaxID=568900 RepID=A0A9N8E8D5_9STRA|nr:Exostosin-1 [Seminavis robusta]|eukprot:Sro661_g183140.1 Exostosin-1 (483) ;mRNA; f:17135-18583
MATIKHNANRQGRSSLLLAFVGVVSFLLSQNAQRGQVELLSRQMMEADGFVQDAPEQGQAKSVDSNNAVGSDLLQEPQYTLNDPTMRLSPYVERPWLHFHSDRFPHVMDRPKRKLILTDIGWNHPNKKKGLAEFPRSLLMRELLQAFIDHPLFDPTFDWRAMAEGRVPVDTSLEYVVLMDIETCFESNYPVNVAQFTANADTLMGRVVKDKGQNPCYNMNGCGKQLSHVLDSPLFQQVNASTLVYFNCGGSGPGRARKERFSSHKISVVSISAGPDMLNEDSDMGMPPPAIHPVVLSHKQRQSIINSCDSESDRNRPYLLSFVGKHRKGSPRKELVQLHNGNDVISMRTPVYVDAQKKGEFNETFPSLLRKSKFGAVPRGDNRFSYRFTEVLSGGAIPVVHSDGWILPFREELVDWSKCAVVIPEKQMNQTVEILRDITETQRCRMRRYCYEVYEKYMVNPEANIAGILDSIEAAHHGKATI